MNILMGHSLKPYTSWKVGGEAEYFLAPLSVEELKQALSWAFSKKLKFCILGGGTNVLISDEGVEGLVICTNQLTGIEFQEQAGRLLIEAQAGVRKSEILKIFLKYKLAPALFLAGLPGDVGGGVVMNAGIGEDRVPREFCEIVDWVEVLSWQEDSEFQVKRWTGQEIQWQYRKSLGWQPGVIVKVGLSWPSEVMPDVLEKVRAANKIRLKNQPLQQPSCGSVFRNPPEKKAAQLIDSLGLKGYSVGDAEVSTKHANFIVNKGNARAKDIDSIIRHVESQVLKHHNIQLHTEVVRMGVWRDQ